MKKWIPFFEDCEKHGADVEVLTDASQEGEHDFYCYDGDECRCTEGCSGWMTADEDTLYCNWEE